MEAKPTYEKGPRREELLMKDGDWEIRAHTSSCHMLNSYIQHYCAVAKQKYYWYSLPMLNTACHGCKGQAPDGIMGLWKLHNMDYIQAGVNY